MPFLDTYRDLCALFSRQVQAKPQAVAVEDDTTSWTYAELDQAAGLLAARLRSSCGVTRDSLVGVLMGHNVQYVVACLAALKAGGAFLVLEVAYPPGQLADVIEDAKPAVVLTSSEYADKVPSATPRILLERGMSVEAIAALAELPLSDDTTTTPTTPAHDNQDSREQDEASLPPLPVETDLDRLAFVSYSSGTTGRPKGIANPHGAAVRSYDLRFHVSNLQPGDRVACNVFFVWEILRPLLRGATTVVVPDEVSFDPAGLMTFLAEHRVTETLMTPTLLATVLGSYPDLARRVPHLKTLWLNGEVVSVDLVRRAMRALPPNIRLLNCYSVSETHEVACGDLRAMARTLAPDATVYPVGPPVDPAHTYVCDEEGKRVETGVSGELYVGGALLARGYLNRPETTAEAFLPDLFDGTPGARMYRTGDKARMLPSGDLEISGRVGGLIKVRGYTVHPATVENAIVRHLAVRSCVILPDREGLERQLVAYVVREQDVPIPSNSSSSSTNDRVPLAIDSEGRSPQARRLLANHIAHYMIPMQWIELDTLPTHKVSGKVDVRNLPSPRAGPSPPETPPAETIDQALWTKGRGPASRGSGGGNATVSMEEIKQFWAVVLDLDESSIVEQYDFFDLGGHSLALADLAGRLSKAYNVTVPLQELTRTPTLAGHAAAVAAAIEGTAESDNSHLLNMMNEDRMLPDDIRPSATSAAGSPTKSPIRISEATEILLTGATGFLGAFLLHDLIKKTTANVLCLVRLGHDSFAPLGMARLRKHLLALGLWDDSMVDRIEIVSGDLKLPNLGLSTEEFDSLAARVDTVVHAGANVNLVYPYDALRDANIGGTKEVLRLAAQSGSPVHYVSTNGVLPPAERAWKEDDILSVADDVVAQIHDGYGQTKWVAEQLVLEAGRRGLPARIYRPGTLGGHSRTGAANPRDVVTALVVESLRIGHRPSVGGWRVEMTPVDFASSAIVALADTDDAESQARTVFHVGDPNAVTADELFDRLADLGYATKPVGWDEWVSLWTESQKSIPPSHSSRNEDPSPVDILRSGMPSVDFLKLIIMLDDTQTKSVLATKTDLVRPELDLELLRTYARHFYSRGWLAKGPRVLQPQASMVANRAGNTAKSGPLAGKVAVITGASSGIGAAVAAALAKEGANVALGARRVGELKTLQARLEGTFGVKVLAHPTDVTDAEQVRALVRTAAEQLGGPVDILVACAGVMYYTMMANAQTEEWDRTVDVNCKGLLHCLAATVPDMLARGKATGDTAKVGHVVAISSDAGRKVFPGLGVYSGSKFFVEAVLQSLRLETAGTGLRVTSVQPGNTATDLLGISTDKEAIEKYGTPTGAQVLSADDVASAVVYALRQPPHVSVNEVLIEPRDEPI